MKFKNAYNNLDHGDGYEINTLPTLTVPDQSMTINELLKRFSSGLSYDGQKVPIYNGDEFDMPDMAHLDLAEREEVLIKAKAEIESLKLSINKKQAQRQHQTLLKQLKKDWEKEQSVKPETAHLKTSL